MWYYAHNAMDNSALGQFGVVDSIVEWLAAIQVINSRRLSPDSSPDMLNFADGLRSDASQAVRLITRSYP